MTKRYTLSAIAAAAGMVTPIYAHASTQIDFSFTGTGKTPGNTVTGYLIFNSVSNGQQKPGKIVITSGGNVPLPSSPFVIFATSIGTRATTGSGFKFSNGNIIVENTKVLRAGVSLLLGFEGVNRLTAGAASSATVGTSNVATPKSISFTTVTPAPEPASIALLGAGIAGLATFRRRRRRD